MENLKIKVNNETESEEAQELFFELGYSFFGMKIEDGCFLSRENMHQLINKGVISRPFGVNEWVTGFLYTYDGKYLGVANVTSNYCEVDAKEITLPQLRDLVVLKRNDLKDANVSEENCLYDLYLTKSRELYFYHCGKNKWILSNLNGDDDYYELLKPIEKTGMKEYLRRNAGGTYSYVGVVHPDHVHDLLIEIPEGSEVATSLKFVIGAVSFLKRINDSFLLWSEQDGEWGSKKYKTITKAVGDNKVLWQRHTQPEELPFVDDLPDFLFEDTVNHSSHNHYFIDVSDVDEVDFYEIALRYNVTDPCIQHILKKCLAVGNRGHKDFHTDLKDIYDTADRALRIHGG